MQKLRFVNADGTVIELTDGNYGVVDWSGLSDSEIDIQSQQVPFHDGSVFLDALIKERTISVTVAVNDFGSLEERYRLRRELIKALNPKNGEGYLYYRNDFIEKRIGAVAELPSFSNKNQNDSGTLKASLTFNCLSPLWEDVEETAVDLNIGENVTIENEGDVDTNVKMEFLTNQVENPRIENLTTGQKISLNGIHLNKIVINTNFGKKNIHEVKEVISIKNILGEITSIADNGKVFVICSKLDTGKAYYGTSIDTMYFTGISGMTDVVFSDYYDKFFGVGERGMFESSDGINWNHINILAGYEIRCVNKYICMSCDSGCYFSENIQQWKKVTISNLTDVKPRALISGRSGFYIAFGTKLYEVNTSSEWSVYHNCNREIYSLDFMTLNPSDSRYDSILVGCADGVIFKFDSDWFSLYSIPSTKAVKSIYREPKTGLYYVGSDDDYLIHSLDLYNWTDVDIDTLRTSKLTILGSNKILGAVIVASEYSDLMYSWDGLEFDYYKKNDFPNIIYQKKFIPQKNLWIAACKNAVCTSTDNLNWTWYESAITQDVENNKWASIEYISHLDMIIVSTDSNFIYSYDGYTWNTPTNIDINFPTNGRFSYNPVKKEVYVYSSPSFPPRRSSDVLRRWDLIPMTGIVKWCEKFQKVIIGSQRSISLTDDFLDYTTLTSIDLESDIIDFYEFNNMILVQTDAYLYLNPKNDSIGYAWLKLFRSNELDKISNVVYDELNNSIYCVGTLGVLKIQISKNVINSQSKLKSDTSMYYYADENLNLYGNVIARIMDIEDENIIDTVTSDSDMNLKLAPGKNVLRIDYDSGDMSARVVYRQKYVGV